MLITMVQYQQPNILVPLSHDTGNVFLILQKEGVYKLQRNLLHQRQSDKYSSFKTPTTPSHPLRVKGTLPTCPIHIPIPSFFLSFFILYTRQDLAKLIFHLFHIISNPKFNVHTKYYYFISWPSLHFLIKGHNLFNLSLPFLLKTKYITILI